MSRTVLITGASKGLGFHLARVFAAEGWNVVALARRGDGALAELAAKHAGRFDIVLADVGDETSVRAARDAVAKTRRSIDMLVNNAALYLPGTRADILDVDVAEAETMLRVNSIGSMIVVKHFLPLLLAGSGKLLVNVSSEAGSISDAWRKNEYGYCMSKAALNMLSRLLQNRLEADGIKVIAMHPGWLTTDMGGPDATDPVADVAGEIYGTLTRAWKLADPIYVDRAGKAMNW